jgi:hypothetical protein
MSRAICEKHGFIKTINRETPYSLGVCPECASEGLVTSKNKWPHYILRLTTKLADILEEKSPIDRLRYFLENVRVK